MTCTALVQRLRGLVDEDWDGYVARIPAALEKVQAGDAWGGYLWASRGTSRLAALVAPQKLAVVAPTLASIVDAVVAELASKFSTDATVTVNALGPMELGNDVECVGAPLAAATRETIIGWIPRMDVKRDAEWASWFWTTGFLALGLGDQRIYRRFTGVPHDAPIPFQPGQTFGFNLQGLAAHLAGAIETRASIEAVMPAFEEFLCNLESLHIASRSAEESTALAIARVVYHRIGGIPLAKVAEHLRDKLAALAEAE